MILIYYYNIDTKIVYIGESKMTNFDSDIVNNYYGMLIELKSEEYENYIYNIENNQFIGINY